MRAPLDSGTVSDAWLGVEHRIEELRSSRGLLPHQKFASGPEQTTLALHRTFDRVNQGRVTSSQASEPVIESRKAVSIVDVVWIDPRSIPSSAMVCAIAGEIPEMMVLQPINTAALAILIK